MDVFTLKQSIFWLCAASAIISMVLMPASVLFHHLQSQTYDRSGLLKEFFWLLIAGLLIFFMVFPAGEQMVDEYLVNKLSINGTIDGKVVLNPYINDPR